MFPPPGFLASSRLLWRRSFTLRTWGFSNSYMHDYTHTHTHAQMHTLEMWNVYLEKKRHESIHTHMDSCTHIHIHRLERWNPTRPTHPLTTRNVHSKSSDPIFLSLGHLKMNDSLSATPSPKLWLYIYSKDRNNGPNYNVKEASFFFLLSSIIMNSQFIFTLFIVIYSFFHNFLWKQSIYFAKQLQLC